MHKHVAKTPFIAYPKQSFLSQSFHAMSDAMHIEDGLITSADRNELASDIRKAIINSKANACPMIVRLAWHASGTYSKVCMRFVCVRRGLGAVLCCFRSRLASTLHLTSVIYST